MNKATSKFNQEFAKIKRGIFDRDGWKCMFTEEVMDTLGITQHHGQLTVDHIRKRSLKGTNEVKNLITLCEGCHSVVESMNNRLKEELLTNILMVYYDYDYSE